MGRSPCCENELGMKRGPWSPEEDKILVDYIQANGHGSWRSLPKLAGLQRCGKSCRLRWTNYLRPDIKRGPFTEDEQKSIIQLHGIVGNKWSTIASQLPGRTDNEIKNYWNTHLKKRLLRMGINPETYSPPPHSATSPSSSSATTTTTSSFSAARHMAQWESTRLEAEARLSRQCLLFSTTTSLITTPSTATSASANQTDPADNDPNQIKKEPVDVFLRMWNSDIGDAFRTKTAAADNVDKEQELASRASSSSCNTKQSSAVTVLEANAEMAEAVESKGSNETDDETYQFYLELAAGDDLSLFQSQMGSCYSLFGSDLTEAALDNPFK